MAPRKTAKADMMIAAHIGPQRKIALTRAAKREGISVSLLVRRLIDAHLGDDAPKPPASYTPADMVL